jgi:HlyD family secretion protein
MPAFVQLTAYNQRRTKRLTGRVEHVSPDRVTDAKGEKNYFLARVVVDKETLAAERELKLYPGIPAVVFIETGQQTMLEYLLTPLLNGIDRAFHEE